MAVGGLRDRTAEFHSAVAALGGGASSSRAPSRPDNARAPLLEPVSGSAAAPAPASEFSAMAARIARGIQATATKLEKLGKLAKRRTLFDDRPVEIAELTAVIKQDIKLLTDQVRALDARVNRNGAPASSSAQQQEHSRGIVTGLENSLKRTTKDLAEVLEVRTQNLMAQKERRDQFAATPPSGTFASGPLIGGPALNSPLYDPTRSTPPPAAPPPPDGFVSIDMGGGGSQQQQLMAATADQNYAYINDRATAIEGIESTMVELGQIFQQLGTLVAQQREQVLRIDDNVQDIENNMELARKELFKYWTSVSSNRMLMAKIFAVVLVFFVLFVMFL